MVPALTAAGWGTAAPLANGYARTDPESVAQIAQVWGCPTLLLLPTDGPAAPAQPQLPASAIEASMLESALTKAVVSTGSTAAPHIQQLSSWFASLPAEEQVAVSRVLQGATGRLSVQRRKAGPAGQAETAAQPAAAKPTPLADRTNHQHAARSASKVVKVLAHQAFAQYAKKKGKDMPDRADVEQLMDNSVKSGSPQRAPWYRAQPRKASKSSSTPPTRTKPAGTSAYLG